MVVVADYNIPARYRAAGCYLGPDFRGAMAALGAGSAQEPRDQKVFALAVADGQRLPVSGGRFLRLSCNTIGEAQAIARKVAETVVPLFLCRKVGQAGMHAIFRDVAKFEYWDPLDLLAAGASAAAELLSESL